jgi:outer membrane immunogenic protein
LGRLGQIRALTLGLFVSTALSGGALAQDVGPSVYDWSGFYVGAHVGYGWIDLNGSHETDDAVAGANFADNGEGPFDLDDNDVLAGIQAGVNHRINEFLIGIEGDLAFTGFSDSLTSPENDTVSFDTDLVATLRARAGIVVDQNLLLFATIGAAWTDTRFKSEEAQGSSGHVDLDGIGLAVGGGAEFALNERWSIKADALYLIFDDKEKTESLNNDSEVGDFIELEDLFLIRLGVNFHL